MSKAQKARVIGYIRVSTDAQAGEGVSLAAQREKLEAYAVAMDLSMVGIEADAGLSGKSLRRPGLRTALEKLDCAEADGLLVCKLDRLTRSVRDLGMLLEQYFTDRFVLLSVGDSIDTRSAGGRLVLHVLASVSQWEREAIGERTREALRHLRSQGVRLGGEALGWRRTKETDETGRRVVVRVKDEEETARRIVDLRDRGLSFRAIAAKLEVEGRATKAGGRWHASTVRQILRRAA